jgi:cellulose biosynthesis protein BcsQ
LGTGARHPATGKTTEMNTNLRTTLNGKNYKVLLIDYDGRAIVWVKVERVQKDGTTVWAFLSHRQYKAEGQVKRRFAAEINAHLAKFPG